MQDHELKACPFCLSSDARVYLPTCTRATPYNPADRAFPKVRCRCGAEKCGDDWDQSGRTAIAAWNRRAQASAEPVATVYTMEALVPGGSVKCHAQMHKAVPAGTKLYALDTGKDLGALAREGE